MTFVLASALLFTRDAVIGADARLTDLRTVLAGDCPRVGAAIYEQCGVHYPQLVRLWRLIRAPARRSLSPGLGE